MTDRSSQLPEPRSTPDRGKGEGQRRHSCYRPQPQAGKGIGEQESEGSVRRVLQKPVQASGHGMLVKFDVTDPGKVARHDREGWYERNG